MSSPKWIVNSATDAYKKGKTAITPVHDLAQAMQRKFEEACEAVSTRKVPTVLVYAPDKVKDTISASLGKCKANIAFASSASEFLVEIGKNNLIAIVVDLDLLKDHEAMLKTLEGRDIPVLPLFQRAGDIPNRWGETFGKAYWTPLEIHKVVDFVKHRISTLLSPS